MAKVNCPHCDAILRYTADQAGSRVRCGICETAFGLPHRYEARLRRPRRENHRPAGGFPWGAVAAVVVVVVFVGGLVGSGVLVVSRVSTAERSLPVRQPTAAEPAWLVVEEPGRFRCQMPGPTVQKQVPGPPAMVMHECSPHRDLTCLVGYTRDVLPPDRLEMGSDQLLEDGCEGVMRNVRDGGGSELSRRSLLLDGRYAGRELVVSLPREGKFIYRLYVVNGITYMVVVGGRDVEPGGPVATKVFDSFAVF